ncbi:MAG: T9SS type A sorting domain-containing protein [Candidatus Zixiibacteriota bacterium]
MKQFLMIFFSVIILFATAAMSADSVAIRLYNVSQDIAIANGADIYTDNNNVPILYRLELSLENDDPVYGMSIGLVFGGDSNLRINWQEQPDGITRGGATYDGFPAVTVEDNARLDPDSGTGSFDFDGFLVNAVNSDAIPSDSILVGGSRKDNFLPAGPMEHMINYYFTLAKTDTAECAFDVNVGKVGPAGDFIFVDVNGRTYVPGFSGRLDYNVLSGGGIILDVGDDGVMPDVFSLSQNYPNPFNPTTRIDYSLAHGGHVAIEVYNVLGQRVNTLVDADQSAGQHTAIWDGDDSAGEAVASGIYLYRMITDEFVETRKMVLMR